MDGGKELDINKCVRDGEVIEDGDISPGSYKSCWSKQLTKHSAFIRGAFHPITQEYVQMNTLLHSNTSVH